jgi:hypothetical protein
VASHSRIGIRYTAFYTPWGASYTGGLTSVLYTGLLFERWIFFAQAKPSVEYLLTHGLILLWFRSRKGADGALFLVRSLLQHSKKGNVTRYDP